MQLSHKITSTLRLTVALLLTGLVGVSCSNIDEADRLIKVETARVMRPALIEDYTGQNCVNCPTAHEVIEKLVEQYGDSIIAVSIHAGDLAVAVEKTRFDRNAVGLKTKQGQEMNDLLGINSWPKGTVNGGSVTSEGAWTADARSAMCVAPALYASASAVMGADSVINVKATFAPLVDFKGTVHFWVVESGIVAMQKLLEGGTDKNYVHNNVFREAIGGIEGQPLELTTNVPKSVEVSTKLRYNDQERWNADNVALVVIVRNPDRTVAQCTRTKLKR